MAGFFEKLQIQSSYKILCGTALIFGVGTHGELFGVDIVPGHQNAYYIFFFFRIPPTPGVDAEVP